MQFSLRNFTAMGFALLIWACGSGYSYEDIPRDNAGFRNWQSTTDAGKSLYARTEFTSSKSPSAVTANLQRLSDACYNKTNIVQSPGRYTSTGFTGGGSMTIDIRSKIVKQDGITSLVIKRADLGSLNLYGDEDADRYLYMLMVDVFSSGSGSKIVAYTGNPNSTIGKLSGGASHLAQIKNAVEGNISCDVSKWLGAVS